MPGGETRFKAHDESDSEGESEVEPIVKVDIDPSKLTPLSLEVISEQVSPDLCRFVSSLRADLLLGHYQSRYACMLRRVKIRSLRDTLRAGTIGHVAHGKSTVVKAISGVMTVRFKNELVRNITIKLGYANAKVRSALIANSFPLPQRIVPAAVLPGPFQSLLNNRSTSAKTKHALDRAAIGPTGQTRRTTRLVNVQAATPA